VPCPVPPTICVSSVAFVVKIILDLAGRSFSGTSLLPDIVKSDNNRKFSHDETIWRDFGISAAT